MKKTLLKFVSSSIALCLSTTATFAQQPPPPRPGGQQPPPSGGSQPPQQPPTQPPQQPPTQPPQQPPTQPPQQPPTQPPQQPPTQPSQQPPTQPPQQPPTQPSQQPPTQLPQQPPTQPPTQPTTQPTRLGAPLPGLTADQLAAFNAGLASFRERETAPEGLGPIFNDVSCVACHNGGGPGGASRVFVTRFGRTEDGVFDPLENLGGSLHQRRAINRAALEVIPREANIIARRQTTPLFGLGLIEAIEDNTIIALAARPSVDGVTGRVAIVTDVASGDQRVGRFGWKNQHATILSISGDAYLNEMGITNRLFPEENAPNGKADVLARFDRVSDIEDEVDPVTGRSDIDVLTDFQRLLAPPSPVALTATSTAGKALFASTGCAVCHVPELKTGASPIAALSQKTIALYSDLLLHDMASLGDGIPQADAGPNEFRTPPLWGLRSSAPYLHDGRAANVDRAIRAHDGEGRVARDRYNALTAAQRAQLLAFLNTL